MAETGQRPLAANGAVARPPRVALRMEDFTSIHCISNGRTILLGLLRLREKPAFIGPDNATLHEKLLDVGEASGAHTDRFI